MKITTIHTHEIPKRQGVYEDTVQELLEHLRKTPVGRALRVELDQTGNAIGAVRSVLKRNAKRQGIIIRTAFHDGIVYIWRRQIPMDKLLTSGGDRIVPPELLEGIDGDKGLLLVAAKRLLNEESPREVAHSLGLGESLVRKIKHRVVDGNDKAE